MGGSGLGGFPAWSHFQFALYFMFVAGDVTSQLLVFATCRHASSRVPDQLSGNVGQNKPSSFGPDILLSPQKVTNTESVGQNCLSPSFVAAAFVLQSFSVWRQFHCMTQAGFRLAALLP